MSQVAWEGRLYYSGDRQGGPDRDARRATAGFNLTRAIGSNDGGEPLKWSDNLSTLVRFKVLNLNQFQETHDSGASVGEAAPYSWEPRLARAGNSAVQAGCTVSLAIINPSQS